MLQNYLKITFAVLQRRKFFTFISLFGISFTLTILVIVTAFIDHLIAAGYPEVNREKSLYSMTLEERDTKNQGSRMGPMSFWFINRYIKTLKNPEKVSLTSMVSTSNTYINNQKIRPKKTLTTMSLWQYSMMTCVTNISAKECLVSVKILKWTIKSFGSLG